MRAHWRQELSHYKIETPQYRYATHLAWYIILVCQLAAYTLYSGNILQVYKSCKKKSIRTSVIFNFMTVESGVTSQTSLMYIQTGWPWLQNVWETNATMLINIWPLLLVMNRVILACCSLGSLAYGHLDSTVNSYTSSLAYASLMAAGLTLGGWHCTMS